MEAEIISVGTEITLGQIINSNARFLADQLRRLDIESYWQTVTDDEPSRIQAAIVNAQGRADLIFVCGGLGPTADDKTLASTAQALGVSLATDERQWQSIQADFARRQAPMVADNIRQAYYLAGGEPLDNPVGLAIGSFLQQGQHTYVVLPGPPREFKAMVLKSLVARLRQLQKGDHEIYSRVLHFVGYPESALMTKLNAGIKVPGVLLTSYVQPEEIQVRATIHDVGLDEAKQKLDQVEHRAIDLLGDYYFGSGEGISLAGQVVHRLRQEKLTITAAESLTGGMLQSTICSVPGASNVFNGGFVTYAAAAKEHLLGISADIIQHYGVVSSQTAEAMASKSAEKMHADIGVGLTGVAGPDALENHPAGTVWIGLSYRGQSSSVLLHLSSKMGRQSIRQNAVQRALLLVWRQLIKEKGTKVR